MITGIAIISLGFLLVSLYKYELSVGLFFLLLPTYLIRFSIGPLPSTLLEVMLIILVIVGGIKYKNNFSRILNKLVKKHPTLLAATTLFIVGSIIGVHVATDIQAALGEWKAFYIEPIILSLVLAVAANKNKKIIDYALIGLLLSGLATGILAIYQHFTGWMVPFAFWENRNTYRVTAWYGFPNGVGLFLSPIIPIALYIAHSYSRKYKEKLKKLDLTLAITAIIAIPIMLASIWYAKSMGGLIGIMGGIGVLLLLNKKTRIPILFVGILSLAVIIFAPDSGIKQELLLQDRSGQLRINMWAETIELLKVHPVVGAGIASYKELIFPYRIDKWIEVFHHPHNLFLTMWVNIGITGLFGFVWILVWFYRSALSRITYHVSHNINLIPYLVSIMTVIVVMGLVDSPYIKNDLAILFWLIPTLLLVYQIPSKKS